MTGLDRIVVVALGLSAASAGLAVRAASPGLQRLRASQEQVQQRQVYQLLQRIGKSADEFDRSLEPADDGSQLDDPRGKDEVRQAVNDFRHSVARLRDRIMDRHFNALDVEEVLRRGTSIEGLAERHRLGARAEEAWLSLRADLDQLARAFTIPWNWSTMQATASPVLAKDGRPRATGP